MTSQPTGFLPATQIPNSNCIVRSSCNESSVGLREVESGDGAGVVAESLFLRRRGEGRAQVGLAELSSLLQRERERGLDEKTNHESHPGWQIIVFRRKECWT